jgi:hypothetical protein
VVCGLLSSSCKKENKEPQNQSENNGQLQIDLIHKVDGNSLLFDTLIYINQAGNHYKINDFEYFISEVTLYNHNGSITTLAGSDEFHYVDNSIPSTMIWNPQSYIPEGKYDSITFIFGINEEKNITGLFVNPPEVNMTWPRMLGGGYHYMKLNGFWKDNHNILQSLNFHLGIGQIYKNNSMNPDSVISFVQNYFTVTIPNSSFTIYAYITNEFEITMNIDKWFNGPPYIFDFNKDGFDTIMHKEHIMMDQQAMSKIVANGKHVFSFRKVNTKK